MFRAVRCTWQGNKLLNLSNQGVRIIIENKRTTGEDSQQALPYLEIKEEAKGEEKKLPILPPTPLELCCMSGCQNCGMIQHAEELIKMYGDDSAARAALEEIPDEGLKAFLKMELMLKK